MPDVENQLRILEVLADDPETTQANLAAQIGVAVGSVNWYLKRLIKKGYIKATRMERNRLKYFVTPQGLALKARLTKEYMEASLRVYRQLRRSARETLAQVRAAGHDGVSVAEESEAMEIFRLTCLEEDVAIEEAEESWPVIHTDGVGFGVEWGEDGDG